MLGGLNSMVSSISGFASAVGSPSSAGSTYDVYTSGSVYYAKDPSGKVIYSDTDAVSVIQAAINKAAYGDLVRIEAGNYAISKTLYGKNGVSLSGNGAVFNATRYTGIYILKYVGSVVSQASLQSASAGSTSITVGTPNFAAPGDLIKIYEGAVWKSNGMGQMKGELAIVASVSGNTLVLKTPLMDSYSGALVGKYSPVNDFEISGLKVVGYEGSQHVGITIYGGTNIHIHDNSFYDVEVQSIAISDVTNALVDYNYFERSDAAGMGYGVALGYATDHVIVQYNEGHHCRHVIAIGGGASTFPLGGVPRYLTMKYNKAYDSGADGGGSSSAFDCHSVGEHIDYIGNEVYGGLQGIWVQQYSGLIDGNIIQGVTNRGITVTNYPNNGGITISGNTVDGPGAYALLITEPNVLVTGNTLRNGLGSGLVIDGANGTKVYGNTISNFAGNDIDIWHGSSNTDISGNTISGGANSIKIESADCKQTNIYGNCFTGRSIVDYGTGTIIGKDVCPATTTITVPSSSTSTTTTIAGTCTTHAQCSRACSASCPAGVYGCCYGCNLGQCVGGACVCLQDTPYCSNFPPYQVGSSCASGTTTTTVPPATTTTLPSCTLLTLSPSSGAPGYTVTATMSYSTCKICDYLGCSGSSCVGSQGRTGSGTFTSPGAAGTFGYYACPGGGHAVIIVTAATTTTIPAATYKLTMLSSVGGTTDPAAGVRTYPNNTWVNITAYPASGYRFVRWLRNGVNASTDNPSYLITNADKTAQPVFETIPTTTTTVAGSCTTHAQCSRACSASCPAGVYGCCYGCNLGQCVGSKCICRQDAPYCSNFPPYQVGSLCTSATTTTTSTSTTTTTVPSGYTYTLSILGSTIKAVNSAGTTVKTGSDFGAVFNYLDSVLQTGNSIHLTGGTYPVSTFAKLTKAQTLVDADSGAILSGQTGLNQDPLMIIQGLHNTVKGINFVDNYRGGVSCSVVIMGSYNTVRECTLDDSDRYGFCTDAADHFTIVYNTIYKAQYGISGSDNGANSVWSTNGYVAYNTIGDCNQCGIKMKMWKDVLVTQNTIDVGYKEWDNTSYNNGQFSDPSRYQTYGSVGIRYYQADTPTQNVTVSYNTIIDTTRKYPKGAGILVDADKHLDWTSCPYPASGEKILHNTVSTPWYGLIIQHDGVDAEYNDFSGVTGSPGIFNGWGIDIRANNCQIIGNTGSINNQGTGNTITSPITTSTTTTTIAGTCTTHAQCSRACSALCPAGVYGCCYGCNIGQCVGGACICEQDTTYCSNFPPYQVGSSCASATTTTIPAATYKLTMLSSVGGTTDPAAGVRTYPNNTWVNITAYPASGYKFVRWLRNGVNASTDNPSYLVTNADKTAQPVFEATTTTTTIIQPTTSTTATSTTTTSTTTTIPSTTTTRPSSTTTTAIIPTTTTLLQTCKLATVTLKQNCAAGSSSACEQGETVVVSGTYTGDCAAADFLQADALSSDGLCDIEYLGGNMRGIGASSITLSGGTVSGAWTVPVIASACSGKIISPTAAALYDGGAPGTGTMVNITRTVAGSFALAAAATTTTITTTTTSTTTTTIPQPCKLTSVSLSPNCAAGSPSACEQGETVVVSGTYTGDCAATDFLQADALSSDGSCTIQNAGGSMQGIATAVSPSGGAISSTWTVPFISSACYGTVISPVRATLYTGLVSSSSATSVSGSFAFAACSNHAQCSQVCSSSCAANVYGCCSGCNIGQCNSQTHRCYCSSDSTYCSSAPSYQVGQACGATTTIVPTTTTIKPTTTTTTMPATTTTKPPTTTTTTTPTTTPYTVSASGSTYTAKNPSGGVIYSGSSASTAIQSAITSLPSGRTSKVKILLQGDFTLAKTITIANYMVLELNGKITLANSANQHMLYASGKSNFEIIGGEWDGNKANQVGYAYQSDVRGFELESCTDYLVSGVTVHNTVDDAVASLYCSRATIDHNNVYDCGGAIPLYYTSDSRVTNNIIHDAHAGIYMYTEDDGIVQHVDNNVVTGNTVSRTWLSGIVVSLRGMEDFGQHNTIAYNTLIDCGTDQTHSGISIGWGLGNAVVGHADYNECHDNEIYETGAYVVSNPMVIKGVSNHVWSNTIHDVGTTAIVISGHDNLVENNSVSRVKNLASFGIELWNANSNTVRNNTVNQVPHSCIWLLNDCSGNKIDGNTIMGWGVYGAYIEGSGNYITNNKFYGLASTMIMDSGVGNVKTNNINYPTATPTTTTAPTTTTTTTTLPSCTSLTLFPASGATSYTVTATMPYSTCKLCDYLGCSGSNCMGTSIRTGSGTFTAPGAAGVFGYYACPGGGYASITVAAATTTTVPATTTTVLPTTTTSPTPAAYGYTVSTDGTNYYAKTASGNVAAQGTDFGALMNTLNGQLKTGDVVLFKNGVYLVGATTVTNANKDGITYRGESRDGAIIRAASATSTGALLVIYSGAGGMHPANNIVQSLTFDGNFNTVISPTVAIGGYNNTVENCHFINTMQYGLHAWRGHNFRFINNRVEKAQYGISTGADNTEWNTGGIIANNYITDPMEVGIKLRWIKDTLVYNNTVDVTYVTWLGDVYNGLSYDNAAGITYYHGDGPTQNVTVANNTIYDRSTTPGGTAGVWVSADNLANQGLSSSISANEKIINNTIYGTNWGIGSALPGVVIQGNTISNIVVGYSMGGMGIDLTASPNTQITSNTLVNTGISIRGSSSGVSISKNTISGGNTYWRLDGDCIGVWNDGTSTHADRAVIDGNTIKNCRRYGVDLYNYISNPVSGTTISNNCFSASASGNILDGGTGTVNTNNAACSTATTTTTTSTTSTTTTTMPSCTSLTLSPSSGAPGYTVTATMQYSTCKICDYLGCSGSSCTGSQGRTGSGTFTAPGAAGAFGYYACPGAGYGTLTVVAPTTTTTLPVTTTTTTTTSTTVPATGGTTYSADFESDDSFKWGVDGVGDYMLYGNHVTSGSPPPYWTRGGWPAYVYPAALTFTPSTQFVHGGTQSAKLSIVNTSLEATRRLEVLHDWDPSSSQYLQETVWYYFPSSIAPLDGWVTFHRPVYERMWDQNKAVYYQNFQISVSAMTDGRSATIGQQIMVLSLGKGNIDNNNDGVTETWTNMNADLYSNRDSSQTVPSSWQTQRSGLQLPLDKWFKVTSIVYRNLTDFNNGYVKVWIDDNLVWDVQWTRTVGIAPSVLKAIDSLPSDPQGYLCSGFGLYTDIGTKPKTIYADDVTISSSTLSSSTYKLTMLSSVGGTIDPVPGAYTYPNNTRVNITAYPTSGYRFVLWLRNGVNASTDNPSYLMTTSDKTAQPMFETVTTTTLPSTTTTLPSTTTTIKPTTTTLPQPCRLASASLSPNCAGGSSSACEKGETVSMSGTYTGDCAAANFLQVDALSSDGLCDIQYVGGTMQGVSAPSITLSGGTVSGSWAVPVIASSCSGKTMNPTYAALWKGVPVTGTQINMTSSTSGSLALAATPTTTTTIAQSTTTTQQSTTAYVVSASGSTYYAKSPSGSTLYSGASATSAIQTAINSASAGSSVLLKAATYLLDSTIYGKNGVSLKGEAGSILSLSNLGTYGQALDYSGTTGASTISAAQAAKGATSITVSSASGISAGSLVFIYNNGVEWKGNTRHQKQGEIRAVSSVSGGTVYLAQPLEDTYASGSSVVVVNPAKNFEVSGLTFNGVRGLDQYGVTVEYGQNVKIHDNNFSYCQLNGVGFRNVLDSEIYKNRMVHSDTAGYGYGVSLAYACQNVSVYDNYMETNRHAIAIGGGSGAGIPRHINLYRDHSYNATNAGFDCHPVGEDINYVNCWSESDQHGFNVEMFSGVVSGNLVTNSHEEGIEISNLVGSDNVTISNNTVVGSWHMGIQSNSKRVNILYNNLTNCGQSAGYYAIYLARGSNTDNDAIVYNYSADYNNIYGNTIKSTTGSGTTYIATGVVGTTYNAPTTTTTTLPSASNTYTVLVSGSTYTSKNPSGSTIYSGTLAASAIQSALNSVGTGQTVYIKSGTYPINLPLSGGKNGVTITGDMTTIIKANAEMGYMFLWTGSSGTHLNTFHLNNIIFDGGRTTAWPDTGTTGLSAGPAIEYVDHVIVDGITVQNTKRNPPTKGADGLILQGATGVPVTDYEVKNSHFSNIYGSGIAAAYITHLNIHDNVFVDCAQWYPIGGAVYAGDEVGYVTLSNNDISGHTDNDGIYVGTSRSAATNVLITQNTINIQLYGMGGGDTHPENPGGYAGSGIKLYGTGGEISSNTINWNNAHFSNSTVSWPVYVGGIGLWGNGTNVHDNIVSNSKYGIESWNGVTSVGNHVITSNQVSGCTYGIYLLQTGSTVTGNTLSGCGTPVYNAGGNTVSGNAIATPQAPIIVDSTIKLTSSFDGGGRTYKHGPNLGDNPIFSLTGTGVTLSNVVLDDDNFNGVSGTCALGGTDNTIQDVTLNNCQRYGLIFTKATRGTIRHVTITKAQHGISGSSGSVGEWNPSTDCVIEDNYISGMIIDGIKLKNMLRTTVRNNVIDVYPSNPGYIGDTTTYTKSGIYLAASDTANKDCTIENNYIYQSAPHALKNRGILVNPDQTSVTSVYSSGNRIVENYMEGMEYGIVVKGNDYYLADNTMAKVNTPILDQGTGNTIV
ncbi:MAG: right-handed parallel beta-helix repeat-containing protein [Candidatus Aenigmarchaeota archaeon]|nr:right-handed parallel beta-helix repeat-containing protein [Candidatus Aenigmarchaeota archaeon]